jgi:hypothetical protein
MADYPYNRANVSYDRLRDELVAAGLPIDYINAGALGTNDFVIFTTRDLTDAEKVRIQAILDAHDPRPRRPRDVFAIYRDLSALTAAAQDPIVTDMQLGSLTGRWTTIKPPQDGAAAAFRWSAASLSGVSVGEKRQAAGWIIALYLQQHPAYLKNNPVSPTVNIPGDEPYDQTPVLRPAPVVTSDSVADQG